MAAIDLTPHGITVENVHRNLAPAKLIEDAIRFEPDGGMTNFGALVAYSGMKTGRSPADKRVVKHAESENEVWWGNINIPIEERTFEINLERGIDYLNTRRRLYCVDAFAGWDPKYRMKVRVICARPYHALFMHAMLIRPTSEELAEFGQPEAVIYNAGQFPANKFTEGMSSKTSVDLSLERKQMVILGTQYAGEMKKGVFTMMNYYMPKNNVLSMHCAATCDPESGSSSLLFGLSGTGKTTLSADPKRLLIGDDEHCWSDDGVFNIEGGCYAKAINLTEEAEPDIFHALKFGSVLENVVYDEFSREVDYSNDSITENTRGAYPIEYIPNAKVPCMADHPRDVIFLTCDAFGVLPPVARLSTDQAMYHFINGYTAKVAGTEMGVTEPAATFSPCFGGPFLVWHPNKYAELLADRLEKHGARVWLVNTGWSGGGYGVGSRMKLSYTRAIIDAIHNGALGDCPTAADPVFGFDVVTECPNVPGEILTPKQTWNDPSAYDAAARKLAGLFEGNFAKFADGVSEAVRSAGPRV